MIMLVKVVLIIKKICKELLKNPEEEIISKIKEKEFSDYWYWD